MNDANATSDAAPRGMVFRDAAENTTFGALARVARLSAERGWGGGATRADLVDALLAASTYETALSDGGHHLLAARVARLSDRLAAALAGGGSPLAASGDGDLAALEPAGSDPLACTVKRCEGFAYYALRPADVLAGVSELCERAKLDQASRIVVVGIRTIGTALSALVAAGLRSRVGAHPRPAVLRLTVRPTGHPYDRRLEAPPAAVTSAVRGTGTAGAAYVVVDEGPGLSGSSFLSVAEWLQQQGVDASRIVLHGSRTADPDALVTPDAGTRWRRYQFVRFGAPSPPNAAAADLSGGRWRQYFGIPLHRWPAVWPAMEREKRLFERPRAGAGAVRCVEKFEGLGQYGAQCLRRATAIGEAGFGPEVTGHDRERGTISVGVIPPATPPEPVARVWPGDRAPVHPHDRLAAYCAFRATTAAFHAPCPADQTLLWQALAIDGEQELGATIPFPHPTDGDNAERPLIVTDGRLQPHEWVASSGGVLMKVDAASHGDDHFWPGPTDIAWDLAGAIVEWNMDEGQRRQFLQTYAILAGERPAALDRVRLYQAGYCAFRAAYCGMAIHATDGEERGRWIKERERQRTHGRRALAIATSS